MSIEVVASSLKPGAWSLKPAFEPLDIAACYGTGFTAKAISYGTASLLAPPRLKIGPSHVAMFCEYQQRMVWIESTTLCPHPCEITGRPINGCQAHHPETRIADYLADGGRVDLEDVGQIGADDLEHAFAVERIVFDVGFCRHRGLLAFSERAARG